ncbi:LuxR family transcriptional regulator, quorum-sensing transcription factor LasR/LuxR family transcriptional regulator, quorum-sensing system regulator CciR [Pseudomonas asplenii]|uniref:LuxR family transcriptional regulator, quorum-sensing transcription factor LasR/LuxR family transcriptional regulator, quorum-sensing system regulator CciR n=1 Tax=Pseudomonas asplenii TaxID=53407 RepID=A0A1H1NQ23_9PSED|nr:autoinducer binding domain-containing protein [Pseudomonas asplenii]SDS01097.1 LuxR family transcriptional regulator, quorum-sensing transcription factor LasR/LuxR family transcriptional regulator, quorum-sensing system regulator CciR [Pseudomonas asplenii]
MLFMDECVELLSAIDARTWFESLVFSARKLGYSKVLYALKPNKEAQNNAAEIMSNFPDDWRRRYDNENYSIVDPTVFHSFSSSLPIPWEDKLYKTQKEKEFAEEARWAGLSHGMTLPIHGPQGQVGMLSLSCDPMSEPEYQKTLKNSLGAATLLRDYAVTSSFNHFQQGSGYTAPHLTPRELEILHWAWAEKTTWEIGKILSLSEPTVEFHFKNIRRKLKVTSRRLAVARAIQLDLISP